MVAGERFGINTKRNFTCLPLIHVSDDSWGRENSIGVRTPIWSHIDIDLCSSASVIEHLKQTLVGEPLAFFYCDFGQEEATDATQVMRSVLFQLLDQYEGCRVKPEARQVVDELVRESREGDAALQNTMRLSTLVSRVAGQFCRRPAIIIDALDECREVAHLLHALRGLTAENVRLLVTSRSIQAIKYKFSELPSVSMDKMADAVSADIEMHVNREVDSHPRLGSLDSMLKREVCSTLCRKADGMSVQCLNFCFNNSVDPLGFDGFSVNLTLSKNASPLKSFKKH